MRDEYARRDECARPLSSVDVSFPEHYIFRSQVEGWVGRGGGSIMKLKSLISNSEISFFLGSFPFRLPFLPKRTFGMRNSNRNVRTY